VGREAGPVEVTAEASYEILQNPEQPFNAVTNPIVEKRSGVPLSARVRGTDATTQTYSRLRSFTAAEPMPVGLAAELYNSLTQLVHEGRLILGAEEVGTDNWMGRRLQIASGRPEWTGMLAPVQQVREDVDAGRTEIEFGPSPVLGGADLVELVRANRGRQPSFRLNERTQGRPEAPAEVDGPETTATDSPATGSGKAESLTVLDPAGTARVVIDSADCDDRELRVRELDVCDNGTAKKMLVLASEPFVPEGS
ncbi:MAG: hypothetical protein AAF907_12785, partial [Planctomycetota bacterium]